MIARWKLWGPHTAMVQDPDGEGEWVLYSDHIKELEEMSRVKTAILVNPVLGIDPLWMAAQNQPFRSWETQAEAKKEAGNREASGPSAEDPPPATL